jgi:hypothetical protein
MVELNSLHIQLADLKSAFDEAILRGDSFSNVRTIYLQIKEVEKLIKERKVRSEKGNV